MVFRFICKLSETELKTTPNKMQKHPDLEAIKTHLNLSEYASSLKYSNVNNYKMERFNSILIIKTIKST